MLNPKSVLKLWFGMAGIAVFGGGIFIMMTAPPEVLPDPLVMLIYAIVFPVVFILDVAFDKSTDKIEELKTQVTINKDITISQRKFILWRLI